MSISVRDFGALPDGRVARLYTMRNASGFSVSVSDFGGTVVSLLAPDRNGRMTNVVCGFDSVESYTQAEGYLGATVGRVCNRIARGRFTLDGKVYDGLYINDGQNHLHGGKEGFSHKLWEVVTKRDGDQPSLTLRLVSPDGEEGYPGRVDVRVTYALRDDDAFCISYKATTDAPTILSLTNHAYFNLGGYASGDVLEQVLWLDAESYLRGDAGLIPTGEMVPVEGTAFDFRTPKAIGRDFSLDHEDLRLAGGYDHCFNFTGWQTSDASVRLRAWAYDPASGRKMEVYTNSPCVQFYTANFLKDSRFPLAGGYPQRTQHAFCLETQKMPDAINHPGFTDTVLRPGEVWAYETVYKFTAE